VTLSALHDSRPSTVLASQLTTRTQMKKSDPYTRLVTLPNGVVVQAPERIVAEHFLKCEDMLREGTNTFSLSHELKKLTLLCPQAIRALQTEKRVEEQDDVDLVERVAFIKEVLAYAHDTLYKMS